MLDVLAITLPIFIVIAVGFFAARFGGMSSGDVRAIGAFVLRFALPALIFGALSQTPFAQIVNVPYLVIYTSCSLAVFAAMFFLARTLRPGETSAQAIQALGSSCSSSGFVGYPIAALVVGSTASLGLELNMATENIVVIPLALALAEMGRHRGGSALALAARLIGRLVLNPLIIAIVLGLVASLIGLKLPSPPERAIDMFAAASSAAALFAVGGGLVGLKVAGVVSDVARRVRQADPAAARGAGGAARGAVARSQSAQGDADLRQRSDAQHLSAARAAARSRGRRRRGAARRHRAVVLHHFGAAGGAVRFRAARRCCARTPAHSLAAPTPGTPRASASAGNS